ncbi:MAG: hypothetical protein WA888_19575 [Burkholderiaceae bacterium]
MLAISVTNTQAKEKLSGTNVNVRTLLFFESAANAVDKLLPNGWEIGSPPKGPFKGFNLVVVLIDSLSALDAEGKPVEPFGGAVLAIPAKKSGTTNDRGVMVVGGITVQKSVPGAYGVYKPGKVHIERQSEIEHIGKATADQTWEVESTGGNSLKVNIEYIRSPTGQSDIKSKVHSGSQPGFFRLYRGHQVTELVHSAVTGVNHTTKLSVTGSGPKLGALFDGTEKLIGVLSIPSYVRSVYLPE